MSAELSECRCFNCQHCIRAYDDGRIYCYCDIDDHNIGFVEYFECWCIDYARNRTVDNKNDKRGGTSIISIPFSMANIEKDLAAGETIVCRNATVIMDNSGRISWFNNDSAYNIITNGDIKK